MNSQSVLNQISKKFHNNKDKYSVHHKIKKHIEELCHDKDFIQNVIKDSMREAKFFGNSTNLFFSEAFMYRYHPQINSVINIIKDIKHLLK